jgi:acyl-CoA thioester hydrolase
MDLIAYKDFPLKTFDKIRYADTDRQGHVNNAVFSTYFETGRAEMVYDEETPLLTEKNTSFVIASFKVDYLLEIKWPGQINIGTAVTRIGNSSIGLYQQLFQEHKCVAKAETVIVQVDDGTAKSKPLSKELKANLEVWLLNNLK